MVRVSLRVLPNQTVIRAHTWKNALASPNVRDTRPWVVKWMEGFPLMTYLSSSDGTAAEKPLLDANFVDDDELQAALARSRRAKLHKPKELSPEEIARTIAEERNREQSSQADDPLQIEGAEDGDANGPTFDDTSEFARAISYNTTAVKTEPVEDSWLKDPETEELEFVTDPTEKTQIQGDLIILGRVAPLEYPENAPAVPPASPALPADTPLARYTFSEALSRSTALSGLEESLEDYLSSIALLPHSLEKTGKLGLSREVLIKKLGALMKFRQGLNLNRENFSDTPDLYWTEPELEGFFKSTAALEVKARTNAVNEKITYATESSTHRMELVIIALIAVEVVIALIQDGPELWQKVFGSSHVEDRIPAPHPQATSFVLVG
ncbi:hypothetical protein BD769DRAFT_1667650 [Suillus cothurnatus]|nr:hypothetical protein BD769DRAFT_1667650 [Suillus cothurnatus]